jgi:hypothetical protein
MCLLKLKIYYMGIADRNVEIMHGTYLIICHVYEFKFGQFWYLASN